MTQFGFFYDQSRCTGCQTCSMACKSWHHIGPGPLKFLRIYEFEEGAFPDVRLRYYWLPCYHCQKPACIEACPTGAIRKEPRYGAVLIDEGACTGCRMCYDACPYGAPTFESDETNALARKCDMCYDRLGNGESPICTLACPYRALDFGLLPDLIAKYGERRDLPQMPGSEATKPAVLFKPHRAKKKLVPYDSKRAIELMMRRDPMPPVYTSPDYVRPAAGMVARAKLVIKHDAFNEMLRLTKNDEG